MTIWEKSFTKHAALITKHDNVHDFIDAISESDAYKDYMRKYAGSYAEQLYTTFKYHGYSTNALLWGDCTSIKEVISAVTLCGKNTNGLYSEEAIAMRGERWIYASGLNSDAIMFGNVGGEYGVHIRKADNSFFCFSQYGGVNWSTYIEPSKKFMQDLDIKTPFDAAKDWHIEFVQRGNGTTLVMAKREFYSQWLAILDTEKLIVDIRAMIPADQLAEWDAARLKEKRVKDCVDKEFNTVDLVTLNELNAPIKER